MVRAIAALAYQKLEEAPSPILNRLILRWAKPPVDSLRGNA